MDEQENCWLVIAEVAEKLGVSVWTVRRLVKEGDLVAVQFGARGHLRFRAEDVERFLERSRTAVPA